MLRHIFLDTNVVLDLLGEREPFYLDAARLATLADQGQLELFTSSLSFATVHYFLSKYESSTVSISKLQKFRAICSISSIDETAIDKSLSAGFNDFEDAIQYYSALSANCEIIVTRNTKDFKPVEIPIMTPAEFLSSRS